MAVSAFQAGMGCRCPNCGEGRLYAGFLRFRDRCEACDADLTVADVGDGSSFFVMFAALIFIVPSAMFSELAFHPPGWVHLLIWPPVTFGFALLCLRPVKALLFALQWKHKAGEARLEDTVAPVAPEQ